MCGTEGTWDAGRHGDFLWGRDVNLEQIYTCSVVRLWVPLNKMLCPLRAPELPILLGSSPVISAAVMTTVAGSLFSCADDNLRARKVWSCLSHFSTQRRGSA